MPLVRVCHFLNPGVKHLASARASDVPLLDPTVRVGLEIDESYIYIMASFLSHINNSYTTWSDNMKKRRAVESVSFSDDDKFLRKFDRF